MSTEKQEALSIFNSDLTLGLISSILKDVKGSIRFIGALGSGMYPLARILLDRGYRISAYDRGYGSGMDVSEGGILWCTHKDARWEDVKLAVYSLAISEDDPEIVAAVSRGVPIISRAQLLSALMIEAPTRISVSGSHGKSTTTAILDAILTAAGVSHTTVSGAALLSGASYVDTGTDVFLAEACEYKDSFLRLCPTHQLITSVELDHTDYFPSLDAIRASFLRAAERADTALVNLDDAISANIACELSLRADRLPESIVTYGKAEGARYRLTDIKREGEITSFSVKAKERVIKLKTSLIGEYNLYNITAATALCDTLGIDEKYIKEAVESFRAIDRRLSRITEIGGVPVLYDYAHHPTELEAVIGAVKERYGRVTVIFKPHTYSRTASLWWDFVRALCKADFTILLDIYPAREKPIEGITSKELVKHIPGAIAVGDSLAAKSALMGQSDVILLLGAGDVDRVKEDLIRLGKIQTG